MPHNKTARVVRAPKEQFADTSKGLVKALENTYSTSFAFNRWGSLVAVGTRSGDVVIIDFETMGHAATLHKVATDTEEKSKDSMIISVSWSRNGHCLLAASHGGRVTMWDVKSGVVKHTHCFSSRLGSACLHPGAPNQKLYLVSFWEHLHEEPQLVCFEDDQLQITTLHAPAADPPKEGSTRPELGRLAVFYPHGDFILSVTSTGRLMQWTATRTPKLERDVVHVVRAPVQSVQFSFDTTKLLVRQANGAVLRLVDVESLSALQDFQDAVNRPKLACCGLTCEAGIVVGGTNAGGKQRLYVWNVNGQLARILDIGRMPVVSVGYHPLRPIMLLLDNEGGVHMWTKCDQKSWSFAADFVELADNQIYSEAEGEFDIASDGEQDKPENMDAFISVVDVTSRDPDSSEDEDCLKHLPAVPDVWEEMVKAAKKPKKKVTKAQEVSKPVVVAAVEVKTAEEEELRPKKRQKMPKKAAVRKKPTRKRGKEAPKEVEEVKEVSEEAGEKPRERPKKIPVEEEVKTNNTEAEKIEVKTEEAKVAEAQEVSKSVAVAAVEEKAPEEKELRPKKRQKKMPKKAAVRKKPTNPRSSRKRGKEAPKEVEEVKEEKPSKRPKKMPEKAAEEGAKIEAEKAEGKTEEAVVAEIPAVKVTRQSPEPKTIQPDQTETVENAAEESRPKGELSKEANAKMSDEVKVEVNEANPSEAVPKKATVETELKTLAVTKAATETEAVAEVLPKPTRQRVTKRKRKKALPKRTKKFPNAEQVKAVKKSRAPSQGPSVQKSRRSTRLRLAKKRKAPVLAAPKVAEEIEEALKAPSMEAKEGAADQTTVQSATIGKNDTPEERKAVGEAAIVGEQKPETIEAVEMEAQPTPEPVVPEVSEPAPKKTTKAPTADLPKPDAATMEAKTAEAAVPRKSAPKVRRRSPRTAAKKAAIEEEEKRETIGEAEVSADSVVRGVSQASEPAPKKPAIAEVQKPEVAPMEVEQAVGKAETPTANPEVAAMEAETAEPVVPEAMRKSAPRPRRKSARKRKAVTKKGSIEEEQKPESSIGAPEPVVTRKTRPRRSPRTRKAAAKKAAPAEPEEVAPKKAETAETIFPEVTRRYVSRPRRRSPRTAAKKAAIEEEQKPEAVEMEAEAALEAGVSQASEPASKKPAIEAPTAGVQKREREASALEEKVVQVPMKQVETAAEKPKTSETVKPSEVTVSALPEEEAKKTVEDAREVKKGAVRKSTSRSRSAKKRPRPAPTRRSSRRH